MTTFELCYGTLGLRERVRRSECEGKEVAWRPGENHVVQDGCGSQDRCRRCRPAQRHDGKGNANADRAAGLRARAMLVTLGSIVRRVTGRVSRGGSGRGAGGDVVQRTPVHLRPDHRQDEPQRQGGAEQSTRPVPLHATGNLRRGQPLCEASGHDGVPSLPSLRR